MQTREVSDRPPLTPPGMEKGGGGVPNHVASSVASMNSIAPRVLQSKRMGRKRKGTGIARTKAGELLVTSMAYCSYAIIICCREPQRGA